MPRHLSTWGVVGVAAPLALVVSTLVPAGSSQGAVATATAPTSTTASVPRDGRIVAMNLDTGQLETLNPDGTGRQTVTPPGEHAFQPAWSPDGSRIAFASDHAGPEPRIFTVRTDGTGMQQVGDDPEGYVDNTPTYTPDGQHIIFTRCRPDPPGGCALYSMRTNGQDKHAVTPYDARRQGRLLSGRRTRRTASRSCDSGQGHPRPGLGGARRWKPCACHHHAATGGRGSHLDPRRSPPARHERLRALRREHLPCEGRRPGADQAHRGTVPAQRVVRVHVPVRFTDRVLRRSGVPAGHRCRPGGDEPRRQWEARDRHPDPTAGSRLGYRSTGQGELGPVPTRRSGVDLATRASKPAGVVGDQDRTNVAPRCSVVALS